jgi:hypothetical protein
MDKHQISKAIAAHALWKSRLVEAIAKGSSEFKAATASQDELCEFGTWLRLIPVSGRDSRWREVAEAHRTFHLAVGEILGRVEVGDKAGAWKLMASGSSYSGASAACITAMLEWSRHLG